MTSSYIPPGGVKASYYVATSGAKVSLPGGADGGRLSQPGGRAITRWALLQEPSQVGSRIPPPPERPPHYEGEVVAVLPAEAESTQQS